MKKIHKIVASVLSVAAIVSAGSCNNGSGGRTTEATSGAETEATTTTAATEFAQETYDTNKGVQDAVADVKVDDTLHPTQKLVFMGNWDIDNTAPGIELFKANYGVPEGISDAYKARLDNSNKDDVVISDVIDWTSRFDALGKAIAAGLSPDMFPFESDYFPLPAFKNMFQNIDDIIDLSKPEWDGWRDLSDMFTWNGKHYLVPIEFYPYYVLYYRRSVIQEAGFEDPYELFLNGEWDWDAMLKMADDFQKTGENKFVIDGYYNYVVNNAFSSTGVPVVGIDGNKVVNNLNDPNVERAAAFLETLAKQNYRSLEQRNVRNWISGSTLFLCEGFWFYQGDGHKYVERFGWTWDEPDYEIEDRDGTMKAVDYDDVMIVPFPKDPKADKHYHYYKTFGYALCAGSTNIESYKAFNQCMITTLNDPDIQAAGRQQQMENEKWTEKQMELKDKLYSIKDTPVVPMFDFKTGLDVDSTKNDGTAPIAIITINPYADPVTYSFSTARGEYGSVIQSSVDEVNKNNAQ